MNNEIINKVLEVAGDFVKNINIVAPEVVKEISNYFIFLSAMSIIKNLLFLILLATFNRFMNSQILYLESEKKCFKDEEIKQQFLSSIGAYRVLKLLVTIIGGFVILNNSYTHIETIGKALFAPRVFILEKANELIKNNKK